MTPRLLPILLLSACCACLWSPAFGQAPVRVSGRVTNKKHKPVPGASVSIKNSYDGATADSLGNFSFTTTANGRDTLVVTSIGYKDLERPLDLSASAGAAGGKTSLNLVLEDQTNELNAVVINAGSFEAGDRKRGTVLSSLDIVTTAGADADITSAIKTLPGTQQIGEQSGLFVRGGTAEETKVFIDGSLVNNYFYTSSPDIASRGRFSPFLFQGTVFSSGGYSALYGQALSSALLLESVDLPDKTQASLGISSVGLSGGYERLAKDQKSSWGVDYNYTNLWPSFEVIPQNPNYFTIPVIQDLEGNFRFKTSEHGMIKGYAYYSGEKFGLSQPDIDSLALKDAFSLGNGDLYSNLSYKDHWGRWKLMVGSSYSNNLDNIQNVLENGQNTKMVIPGYPLDSKSFTAATEARLAQSRVVLEYRIHGLSAIRFGGEYQYDWYRTRFNNDTIPQVSTGWKDNFTAAFAESDIYITNQLALKLGLREENSTLVARSDLAPRISAAYKVGPGQVSVAYGVFYQKADDNFLLFGSSLGYQEAIHYIANYQIMTDKRTFRLEGFYKKYEDLTKTFPDTANNGFGYARGVELFWRDKKTFKDIDYWVSYSYLDTKRDYLNFPYEMAPNFAAKHTLSVVLKKFVTPWKTGFNASYSFATGRPYYNISDYGQADYYVQNEGTTIPYNNMSLSINYIPSLGRKANKFTVWVLSVNNVFNIKQVYGYNYSFNNEVKLPIEPPASRFVFVGCFISFGVDRTQDAINNNL